MRERKRVSQKENRRTDTLLISIKAPPLVKNMFYFSFLQLDVGAALCRQMYVTAVFTFIC